MRLALLAVIIVASSAIAADTKDAPAKDNYAAVAYSTKTGEYWMCWGMGSREEAEKEVGKRSPDASKLTVIVIKNCYVALVRAKDGKAFGVGEDDTPNGAELKALAECRRRTQKKVETVVVMHAGQGVGGEAYSAIAYSVSAGKYGIAVAKPSKSEAEAEAVRKCGADDAKVLAVIGKDKCCALALGKKKSEFAIGIGATEKAAQDAALAECKKLTDDCTIAITLTGKK